MKWVLVLLGILSPLVTYAADDGLPARSGAPHPTFAFALQPSAVREAGFDRLESLADIALYETAGQLTARKGQPERIAPDPWADCTEYRYANASAGVCGDTVLYVHMTPGQVRTYGLRLNGEDLPLAGGTLRDVLGEPYFIAEDGEVYKRGETALKIYRDAATGEWTGIDLFDEFSS